MTDRRLRRPPPEALGLAMLICHWKPPVVFDGRPGPCPRLRREILSAHANRRVEK
jgi:hypothetical protein